MERLSDRAQDRIFGIGHEQYGKNKVQRFETFTAEEEYDELLDELADAINYIAFIAIKAGSIARRSRNAEANRG